MTRPALLVILLLTAPPPPREAFAGTLTENRAVAVRKKLLLEVAGPNNELPAIRTAGRRR